MMLTGLLMLAAVYSKPTLRGLLYNKNVGRWFTELGLGDLYDFLMGDVVDDDGNPLYQYGEELGALFLCSVYLSCAAASEVLGYMVAVTALAVAAKYAYQEWRIVRVINAALEGDEEAIKAVDKAGIDLRVYREDDS